MRRFPSLRSYLAVLVLVSSVPLMLLAGHKVYEAVDGPSGIDMAVDLTPEVALNDVGLPEMNGYEVARRIRARAEGKAIRLIALTGYGQAEDRRRALDAGFDTHWTKPVSPERLTKAIAAYRPEAR